MASHLQFRRGIVVGASSGIGEAVARALGAEGVELGLVARRRDELERVALEIDPGGRRVRCYEHDVRDYDQVPGLFDRIVRELGGLDLVVYSAGVMHRLPENEYDFAKDRETLEVNLLGAIAWLNLAAVTFEAARRGTIVGVGSVAGERGRRLAPAYAASKAGLATYLESLRNRLSRYGVNVVTVKPGRVATAMTQGLRSPFPPMPVDRAARDIVAAAHAGGGATVFVPRRWALISAVLRLTPSSVFRRIPL